jgi:hypothetical protein
MTFNTAAKLDRAQRFSNVGASSAVEQGMWKGGNRLDATATEFDKKYIRRNIKPYKVLRKKGFHKNLKKLKNLTDKRLENIAVRAVMKKHGYKQKKLNRSFNSKYNPRQIKQAKRRVRAMPKTQVPKGKKLQHVRNVMQNRRITRTNIWKGKGYDIRKGYI